MCDDETSPYYFLVVKETYGGKELPNVSGLLDELGDRYVHCEWDRDFVKTPLMARYVLLMHEDDISRKGARMMARRRGFTPHTVDAGL